MVTAVMGTNPYVALAAEQMGVPYAEALATMRDLKKRYGITYREFAQQKMFQHTTPQRLDRAVARFVAREQQQVQRVSREAGWSLEEAERRMRRAKDTWPAVDFRKFAGYRFAAMTDEQIAAKVDQWTVTANSNREKVAAASGWSMTRVREHMTRFQVLYDIIPAYYVCYRGWELSDEQISGYARQELSQRISRKLNDPAATVQLAQKDVFDRVYADLVKRKFWVNEQDATFEQFLAFAEGLDQAFCKPLGSGGGIGTFTVDLRGDEDALREVYDRFMAQPLVLVEEFVHQHDEISAFYPKSVNTVRVVTLQDDDGVHIIAAGIRFGSTGIVDNFSADGMVADVDLATGRIVTPAVDKKGGVYERHPYSDKEFVGFRLPFWEQILETAREAMGVLPGVNYVGWDVAIGPNGVSLIEGNSVPDLVLVQAPYAPTKVGKRHLFERWLDPEVVHHAPAPAADAPAAARTPTAAPSAPRSVLGQLGRLARRGGLARVGRMLDRLKNPGPAPTQGRVEHEGLVYRVAGRRATLIGRTDAMPERVVVPEQVGGAPVTAVAASVFAECETLIEIELPEGVETLERSLFEGATALRRVGLPYALKRIEERCFKDCTALEGVYYFSQRGISDVMVTDRDLVSEALPTMLEHIGESAFDHCRSLQRVNIPHRVTKIAARAFFGCRSLVHVGLHNRVRSIGADAFRGCVALKSIRVPFGCDQIGAKAFSVKTTVVASRTSFAAKHAAKVGQAWRAPSTRGARVTSGMTPRAAGEEHEPFYTAAQVDAVVERFETRTPSYPMMVREPEEGVGEIPPSRFTLEDGVYRGAARADGEARVMVVGDLMARFRQQRNADRREAGRFDFSFQHVRGLFAEADFVTGNLESMVSPSAPYTLEMEHVDARPHLNAPFSFLAAVRRAGVDCVTHAQNHVYDAGTRGVFETLDAANRAQLMHTGAYASAHDRRFLVVDIGGIRVGIVAYLDNARQKMKKANFTRTGLGIMFPYFDAKRIAQDIADARAAGAEYVIANCHWGREYTAEVSLRQRMFAQRVADAGADYIVGAHSHCVQPYETLTSSDGRRVPVLWSAGNFISDINLKPPITRDTLIVDLRLARDADGAVRLASESYHPCRIMSLRDGADRDYTVVPTSADLGGSELNASLAEARERIVEVVGEGIAVAGER